MKRMFAQIRRILRRDIPKPIRLRIASSRRYLADRFSGHASLIVGRTEIRRDLTGWVEVLSIAQVIRQAELWEGKLHNLRLATGRLNGVVIDPGRIFSFWALAGLPDAINGYQAGRSIREDVLGAEIGGGLCQLSGLAYELGLRAEMDVVERHPHSLDLYTEATRFTPLGLDATVVWGYKDLRLRNTSARSVAFAFGLRADQIIGALLSRQPFRPAKLEIARTDRQGGRFVQVTRSGSVGAPEVVSSDTYKVPCRSLEAVPSGLAT
jgi:vancomycin resistance protein VanW